MKSYKATNGFTSLPNQQTMEDNHLWSVINDPWMGWPAQGQQMLSQEDPFASFLNDPLPTPPRTLAASPLPEQCSNCHCRAGSVEKYFLLLLCHKSGTNRYRAITGLEERLTSCIERTINAISSECSQLAGKLETAREKQEFRMEKQDIKINKLEVIMNKILFAQEQQDSALNFIRASQEKMEPRFAAVESAQQYTVTELRNMGEYSKVQLEELKSFLAESPTLHRIEASQAANSSKLDNINTQLIEAVTAWTKLAEEYSISQDDDESED